MPAGNAFTASRFRPEIYFLRVPYRRDGSKEMGRRDGRHGGLSSILAFWPFARHPLVRLQTLDAKGPRISDVPFAAWGWFVGISVSGSLIYGASLGAVSRRWRPGKGALWLALSAGMGWCVFGPALVLATRRSPFSLAHACLVTMAYGEAVLVTGTAANALLARLPEDRRPRPLPFNLGVVGLSNVVMAAALAVQLKALGVPVRKTLLLWTVALNGSGGVLFALFRRWLEEDGR